MPSLTRKQNRNQVARCHQKLLLQFRCKWGFGQRKLYPSLFRLYKSGNLSDHFAVIGTARRPWSKEYFESVVVESILDLADSVEEAQAFASHFYYQSHDVNDTEHYIELRKTSG